jgi:hypothetical protein
VPTSFLEVEVITSVSAGDQVIIPPGILIVELATPLLGTNE